MLKQTAHTAVEQARHCSIYFFEGWIGVAPTVIGLAQALVRCGYEVTIYCRRTEYASTGDLGAGITVRYVEGSAKLQRWLPRVVRMLEFMRLRAASRSGRRTKAGIHIGVDQTGTILALLSAREDGGPIIHLSLELCVEEKSLLRRCLKWLPRLLFRAAYRRSVCCVIQDSDRLDALSRSLNYVHPNPFFVPNAPTGVVIPKGESNYFREVLSLSADTFPVLAVHAGVVEDVVYSQELARAFNGVDLGCALIFHERSARDPNDPYLLRMRQHNERNLFFSLQPVLFQFIDSVFAAATIGLAFYRPLDANYALIAKASGKMAFHLKHGTPMIMNDLPSLVELNERYEFGVTIHDPSNPREMSDAIRFCLGNYERLSANARRCFEQEFQLETKAAPLLEFIRGNFPP